MIKKEVSFFFRLKFLQQLKPEIKKIEDYGLLDMLEVASKLGKSIIGVTYNK